MMKRPFIFLILLVVFSRTPQVTGTTLILQSTGSVKYNAVVEGIQSVLTENVERRLISSTPDKRSVDREINRCKPGLIIAIGQEALRLVDHISSYPVGFIYASDTDTVRDKTNFFGVTIDLKQSVQFNVINEVLPRVKHIGFIYNPQKVEAGFQEKVTSAAALSGHSVIFRPVSDPQSMAPLLFNLTPKVDAVWFYPDTSLLTPETVECFYLFSLEFQKPIISFIGQYTFKGATVAIDVDVYDSGKQLGVLARYVLAGNRLNHRIVDPESPLVRINSRTLKMIGIDIDPEHPYMEMN